MSYLDIDPTKPTEQLLADIRAAADQSHKPGLALLPFGNLLVKVAGNAEVTINDLKQHISDLNEQNGKLQNWVVVLAVVSLIATVVQTGVAIASYAAPSPAAQPLAQKPAQIPAKTTVGNVR